MPTPFVIVDGSNYIFRAFYALQQGRAGGRNIALSTSYGMPTGALNVFSAMLMRIYLDERPDYAAVVFDAADGTSFRKELDADYKSNRKEVPDDLKPQFPYFEKIVRAFHLKVIREPSVEADDVIATLTRQARARGLDVLIFTGDKDLMQLVDDHVKVVDTMRDIEYDAARVEEKFGVPPKLVGDWLALRGDSSDNVPGMAGIGDVTATRLLKEYGSIDGILANVDKLKGKMQEKFRDPAQLAALDLSRKLVSLVADAPGIEPIDAYRRPEWDARELAEIFRYLEFNKFLSRLEAVFFTDRSKYVTITDEAALDGLIAAARAAGEFAFTTHATGQDALRAAVVGVGMATNGHPAAYVPLSHRYLGAPAQLAAEVVLGKLRPLLEDPAVKKVVHDAKDEGLRLRRLGVTLRGVSLDPQLASYLLDPSTPNHALETCAKHILDHQCVTLGEVCGKGKEAKPFDQVEVGTAAPYGAECADVALALGRVLRTRVDNAGLGKIHDDVELPLARVLGLMQEAGIKVDLGVLDPLSRKIGDEVAALERKIHELAGYPVNPGSPKQLSELLFEKLGLASDKMRRTKTGVYSTDAEQLEEIADQHPIVPPILEHRELIKLKGTYLDPLPTWVNRETGRCHTTYSQVIASTGRIASNNPNLQNIPIRTAVGREIRRAFVAEPGWKLVSADYSQIELRVIAHLSRDRILLDAFARDIDVHTQTAAEVFGVPLAEVTADHRRVAKAVNYGLGYGQSDFGLARVLDIPREQARTYIDTYFARFAGIKTFMDETIAASKKTQRAVTLAGRKIPIPSITSSRYQERTGAERFARNAPIQGSAADILKMAMLGIQRVLDEGAWKARMLLTVHDELVFEVEGSQAEAFAEVARREMENAWRLDVPLKVDVGIADSWADAH